MNRLAVLVLLPLALSAGAAAQDGQVPIMGSSAEQGIAPAAEEKPVRQILVLGDTIGGGLGAGLMRLVEQDGGSEVAIRFNEESGLARPEVYDWPGTAAKILESNSYDAIVVMIGANDRQTIRSGNLRYGFNTPEWIEAYRTQVDMLIDELVDSGAKIVWVGLPPVADPDYDSALRIISALQKEQVERRGLSFLDIRPALSTPDGRYAENGPDETGEVTRLRGADGVSFYKAGNNRMAQLVLEAIAGAASTPAPAAPKAVEAPQAPPPKLREVPLFGQTLANGESFTVRPEDVTANAVLIVQEGIDPAAAQARIRSLAAEGSAAEKLLAQGLPQPGPTGRADDFSVPAPAAE